MMHHNFSDRRTERDKEILTEKLDFINKSKKLLKQVVYVEEQFGNHPRRAVVIGFNEEMQQLQVKSSNKEYFLNLDKFKVPTKENANSLIEKLKDKTLNVDRNINEQKVEIKKYHAEFKKST